MIDAAFKALAQIFTKPFRAVLLKSAGLAIAVLVVLGIALQRLLVWLTGEGGQWVETTLGALAHWPVVVLGWMLAFALGFGLFLGAIFLMPAVTALVAGFFADEIAENVEREHYPVDPPGVALPLTRAALEGLKIALLALVVYLVSLPFLLFAGFGAILFFLATSYLLGREYFEMAAMRFHPAEEAKAMRRLNIGTVFVAGMFIAAFVSIPIVNLATPVFGMAFMVHLYKRLAGGPKRELLEPAERPRITT
ncbi:MAG TPA: sulfate transporter family protein [Xanthobacteraceae bacterium]|nr:sulfate transporter family protein [Xanthobacteraceae bacterium]